MHNIESPNTSDSAIEQEIKAKGKTAPRITPAALQANIKSCHYFTGKEGVLGSIQEGGHSDEYAADWEVPKSIEALELVTFCVLVLANGYTVYGHSACASPENFDAEIGRKIARQNAEQQIWPLMGYALKESLK